ncbi:DNRLRE domain-containing protein [Kitasatospora sp. NBC_00240]|uniref:DNRLRE domain-containing protein n=1 Tax=Kitasatospora sp. NBC_00240 TaxID=2903567 RepID=UPI0022528205|nr:DNRLRE domain-containing protein [Kitasatospora sp. NBC_00240]MCX5214893.1 DNRLRE domain-containing protein [Kitasatospora sp. NBC_00240]
MSGYIAGRGGRRSPAAFRILSGSVALAVAVSLLAGSEAAFAAAPTGDTAKPAPASAADIPSARVAARLSGQRVEALSERTETSTTWVNKDGSLTSDLFAGPVRYRKDGTWVDVDLTLQAGADGSVAPKAHPQGLKLAGAGGTRSKSLAEAQSGKGEDRTLVTLGQGEQQVELQWKGGLPKPVLDGTRATYQDAVADGAADLVVEATRTGFEQYVTLKQRPAAAGFTYTMPLKAKGLLAQPQADGGVQFTDARSGEVRAVLPAPVMWDASAAEGSSEHPHQAKVDLKVVQHGANIDLVFTPDAAFMADPRTRYPLTVDPSTTALGNVFDTRVQQGETVDWSADTEIYWGNSGTKNADGSSRQARSFINWNTGPIADALITSANLSLFNFHSGNSDCLPYTWEVWDTGLASTASRWTAQPTWNTKKATSTETKGRDACGGDGWINADVTNLVQTWTSAKKTTSGMGLRAPDETSTKYWKEVNSANAASNVPKLTVNYNYRPRTGTDQQAGSPFYKDTAGIWWVDSTTPTLRDTFVDPNNDKVDGTFQIFDAATDTQVGNVLVSPYVPSGEPATVTVPAGVLANGKTYKFRTSPYDGLHYNTGWSAWAFFTVDTSAPSAPVSVTSTDYPAGQWVKGAGQPGVFTLTPPTGDQSALEWSVDGATWTKVATGGTTTPVSITASPVKAGTNVLQVRTTDRADNRSETLSYTFQAGAGVTAPNDGTRTAARVPLAAEADGSKYDNVTFSWRRSDADAWVPVPVGDVTIGGTALTAWPVALTAGRSPALAWNATSTVNPDGTVQVRADFTGPNSAALTSESVQVTVDRKADGAATTQAGPGTVNLLTGDLTTSATDASFFGMTVARSHSSRNPYAARNQQGQAPIFGPGWLSGVSAASMTSGFTEIRQSSANALDLVAADGSTVAFTAKATGNGWTPETGSENLTLTGAFSAGDFTLTDTEGAVLTFGKADQAATTWTVNSSLLEGLSDTTLKVLSESVTMNGKALVRPRLVVAPTSAVTAAACALDLSVKGCRALQFVYAGSTTATGTGGSSEFGDFTGQVSAVKLWATAPGAANATATDVAAYRYDSTGALRQEWDPRLGTSSTTQYDYVVGTAAEGALSAVVPPGAAGGHHMAYGNVPSSPAAGEGMLTRTWTNTLAPGTTNTVNGTATTSFVYGVPLSGAKAPEDLSATAGATWGQTDLPTDATAVFPPDQVPASDNGANLTQGAYGRAVVTYLNASGSQVNSAAPGHRITTLEYDKWGNQVRSLTAANRELAIGAGAGDQARLADLGINSLPSGDRARLLSSSTLYTADGQRETESFGPLHRITLGADAMSGATVLAKADTQAVARTRTVKAYDEGRPTDGTAKIKDQVTSTTTGGWLRAWPDTFAETRTDTNGYDWALGLSTRTVKDAGGLALTSTTGYDSQGRVASTSLPASNGSDAGSTRITYYTAGGTGPCAGRPEWADLVCRTAPAGDITGGGSNPAQLTTKTVQYGLFGQVTQTDESTGGVTRTTTVTADAAGRPVTTTVSGGVGATVPAVTVSYDPTTGAVTGQTSASGGTITKAYDALGRLITYTDANGGVTTTEYDALNRATKVVDSVPSTTTYTYDTAVEPRGTVTSMTDSVAGTFTPRYDADGTIVSQGLPGGYTMTTRQDPSGAAVNRTYTRDSDGLVLVSDGITETVHGQQATHIGTPGVTAAQSYTYDRAGRLTEVQDTSVDAVCTTRSYTFDKNTNRTALATATAARGLTCSTSGASVQTNTYDSADRLTTAGYVYDAFGRTTALPGSTVSYFASDLVQQQTTGAGRQTWTLDAAQRFRAWTTETNNAGTWTQTGARTNHYAGDVDSPRWITEDAGGAVTRNVGIPGGALGATTAKTGGTVLQLANLHGDITLQFPLDTAVAPTVLDYDEYGNPRAGQPSARYGWIGAEQRSAETPAALTLMGVRLYNPGTGRFLSVDPVAGGNANAYEYTHGDPLNRYDLDGRFDWRRHYEEARACSRLGIWGCSLATTISGIALAMTGSGARNNAVRHFMWQSALTFFFGYYSAKRIGDAHEYGETCPRSGRCDTAVDKHNNNIARNFASSWYGWRYMAVNYFWYGGLWSMMYGLRSMGRYLYDRGILW